MTSATRHSGHIPLPTDRQVRHPSFMRRMAPSRGDAGVVGLAALVPFLAGASPEAATDLSGVINAAIYAAAAGLGGLVGKGALVFIYSYVRRRAQRAMRDQDPGNDSVAEAALDTVDRLDPDGRQE